MSILTEEIMLHAMFHFILSSEHREVPFPNFPWGEGASDGAPAGDSTNVPFPEGT